MTAPPPFATTPPSGLPDLIEHDACALAAFATRDGRPSRTMVELALTSLQMMVHRSGSVDGEGDGSGLLVDLPRDAWRRRLEESGLDPAAADDRRFTVAHIFFDNDEHAQSQVPRVEAVLRRARLRGAVERRGGHRPRRPGPARLRDAAHLLADRLPGLRARRRRPPTAATGRWCSWSASSTATWPRSRPTTSSTRSRASPRSSRASTPRWPTRRSPRRGSSPTTATRRTPTPPSAASSRSRSWATTARSTRSPSCASRASSSGCRRPAADRTARTSTACWRGSSSRRASRCWRPSSSPCRRSSARSTGCRPSCRTCTSTTARPSGPYAQGPVGLACRAADEMVFAVDAMGLRPLWWVETEEFYVVSSEPGVVPVADLIIDPAPLAPGEKVALVTGDDGAPRVLDYPALQREVYARAKSRGALPTAEARARLAGGLDPVAVEEYPDEEPDAPELGLDLLLASAGWIESDKQQLQFHADRGAEPIGSLGWDGPLGPFTPVPMPLSDYLQETVAVVTNPAIDREREVEHFSTRVVLGRRPPIQGVEPDPPQRCELRMPIILGGMRAGVETLSLPELRRVAVGHGVACMEDVLAAWDWRATRLPLSFSKDITVREHLAQLSAAAVAAVQEGAELHRAPRPQRRPGRARVRPAPRGGGRGQGPARGPQGGRLLVAPRREPGAAGRGHPQRARRHGRARLRRPGAVPLRADGEGDGRLARALRRRHQRPRRPPEGHREGPLHARHPRAARVRAAGVGHRRLARGPRRPRHPGLLRLGGPRPRPGRRGRARRAGTPDPRRRGEPLQGQAAAHVPQGLEGPGARGHVRARLRGVRRDPRPPRGRAAGRHPPRGAAAAGRGGGPHPGRPRSARGWASTACPSSSAR